jgi:hypothetical protein
MIFIFFPLTQMIDIILDEAFFEVNWVDFPGGIFTFTRNVGADLSRFNIY